MAYKNEKNFETVITGEDAEVIDFYDNYAQNWDQRFGDLKLKSNLHFFNHRFDTFIKMLKSSHKNIKTAVELGIGTGVYIKDLSKLFERVIAVDGSSHMIGQLKEKLKKFNISNVNTIVNDVTNIKSIEPETADIVYFFGLIEHVIKKDLFLKEIHRILKQEGIVIGIVVNRKSPWYKLKRFFGRTAKHCSSDHFFTQKELKNLFESHGFSWESHVYWGLVPPGISNSFIYSFLSLLEPIAERSFLASFLGGLTFRVKK